MVSPTDSHRARRDSCSSLSIEQSAEWPCRSVSGGRQRVLPTRLSSLPEFSFCLEPIIQVVSVFPVAGKVQFVGATSDVVLRHVCWRVGLRVRQSICDRTECLTRACFFRHRDHLAGCHPWNLPGSSKSFTDAQSEGRRKRPSRPHIRNPVPTSASKMGSQRAGSSPDRRTASASES